MSWQVSPYQQSLCLEAQLVFLIKKIIMIIKIIIMITIIIIIIIITIIIIIIRRKPKFFLVYVTVICTTI